MISRVARHVLAPDKHGCIQWTGSTDEKGYPELRFGKRLVRVSRLILETKLRRSIRPGYESCHSCGHKWCVTEDHIYEGTHYDNMQDRRVHDGYLTAAKGEKHGNAVLTDRTVRAMRASGLGPTAAARRYGTTYSTAWNVLNRKTWRHV